MVGRRDVVHARAAHQENLRPRPLPAARRVLFALPRAPLCEWVVPEVFAELRREALDSLAAELGGGDGPLPRVDLEVDRRPIGVILAELRDAGVRTLELAGDRDRPGFARAVRARFDGEVRRAVSRSGVRADLLEPWIRGRAGDAPPPGVTLVHADALPPEAGASPVVCADPRRSLGAWSGFVPVSAVLGGPRSDHLLRAWSESWTARGAADAVRCAALGLDPSLEDRLRRDDGPGPRNRGRCFVVTGLDGAGKSTHVERLRASLRERGHEVWVSKLYRQGAFLELANELGARTRRGAPLAAFRVSRIVKLVDSLRVLRDRLLPNEARDTVLLFDRYLETHVAAAGSQLGWDLGTHPVLAAFPPADHCFWLELDPRAALERLGRRDETRSADEHETGLLGYAEAFDQLAQGPADTRLDARADFADNAAFILRSVVAALEEHGARSTAAGSSPAEPGPPPPAKPRRTEPQALRTEVSHRADPDLLELGAEIGSLRQLLVDRIGVRAEGVPESFWIEAHAAQVLLDLWTERPRHARVTLWPEVLARMPCLRDLPMLEELARMIDAESDCSLSPVDPARTAAAFAALGSGPCDARRLAAEYRRTAERLGLTDSAQVTDGAC